LDRWKNRRQQLMTDLEQSQYQNVSRKQSALSDYLGTMPTNGDEMPIHTAGAELATAAPAASLDPELAAIYQAQAQHNVGLVDGQNVANAAAARRGRWMQALNNRANTIQAGQLAGDNRVIRDRQALAEALARNDAEYQSAGIPNSAYNWQLLGSLLSAGGNLGIKAAGAGV
jgi:hypothetical protein